MTHDGCPTDLLAKQRRQQLTPSERRTLEAHLLGCRSCRAWAQIGQDFDDQPSESGDAAVVSRIADGIGQGWIWSAPRRRPPMLRWAALSLAVCSAAAGAGWTSHLWTRRSPPPEVDQSVAHGLHNRSVPPSNAVVQLAEPAVSSESTTESKPAPASAATPITMAPKSSAIGSETALAWYREANQARRDGNLVRAIALFRHLQQSYPRSAEAHLSNVALGNALLESRSAREALQQFERYLAASGARALAAEALYGRARALRAIGDSARERAAWVQLRDEFPRSPYAATASRRLDALE